MRGFDVWGISPQYNGAPIGGYWMLTGKAEYGFPRRLSDDVYLRGAAFTDAATPRRAWATWAASASAPASACAPCAEGQRFTAGINFAWPLNSYRGDDTEVFTFFMGMAF